MPASASPSPSGTNKDPILKERLFGLTGPRREPRRGRQGDLLLPRRHPDPLLPARGSTSTRRPSTPTSYLLDEQRRRGDRTQPEFELDRHRASSTTTATSTSPSNTPRRPGRHPDPRSPSPTAADAPAPLHFLPTLWFRNTWSWGCKRRRLRSASPGWNSSRTAPSCADHATLGRFRFFIEAGSVPHKVLFTENETNVTRLFGTAERPAPQQRRLPRLRRREEPGRRRQPQRRDQSGRLLRSSRSRPESEVDGPAPAPWRNAPPPPNRSARIFDRTFEQRIAEADVFYESRLPTRASRRSGTSPGRRYAGLLVEQAVLSLRR